MSYQASSSAPAGLPDWDNQDSRRVNRRALRALHDAHFMGVGVATLAEASRAVKQNRPHTFSLDKTGTAPPHHTNYRCPTCPARKSASA